MSAEWALNPLHTRRGSIFAAILKFFPVYLFIVPGLICFALAKSGKVPGLAQVYDAATGQATEDARELGLARPRGLGRGHGRDHLRVRVLHRLIVGGHGH